MPIRHRRRLLLVPVRAALRRRWHRMRNRRARYNLDRPKYCKWTFQRSRWPARPSSAVTNLRDACLVASNRYASASKDTWGTDSPAFPAAHFLTKLRLMKNLRRLLLHCNPLNARSARVKSTVTRWRTACWTCLIPLTTVAAARVTTAMVSANAFPCQVKKTFKNFHTGITCKRFFSVLVLLMSPDVTSFLMQDKKKPKISRLQINNFYCFLVTFF